MKIINYIIIFVTFRWILPFTVAGMLNFEQNEPSCEKENIPLFSYVAKLKLKYFIQNSSHT